MGNVKPTGRAMSMPGGIALGVGVSIGITLLSCAVLAWMVDAQRLQWENVGYGIMVIVLAASFLGALLSFQKIKRQRLVVCMLTGLAFFGVLLSITALFFGGQYDGFGVTAALIFAGCASAGLLGLKPERGVKHKKIRKPAR